MVKWKSSMIPSLFKVDCIYFWKNIHTDAIYTNDATLNRQKKTGLASKTWFILLGPSIKIRLRARTGPGGKTVLFPYRTKSLPKSVLVLFPYLLVCMDSVPSTDVLVRVRPYYIKNQNWYNGRQSGATFWVSIFRVPRPKKPPGDHFLEI